MDTQHDIEIKAQGETNISHSTDHGTSHKAAGTIQPSTFDAMPDGAYIREAQLVASPKRPGIPVPLPFSAPTLWRKVRAKTFPAPVRLSARVTAWNVGAVRAWLTAQAAA